MSGLDAAVSRSLVVANRYLDSVALLRLSSELMDVNGVVSATAVMATPANLEAAREVGIDVSVDAAPNDVFVGVRGSDDACVRALEMATQRFAAKEQPGIWPTTAVPVRTLAQYVRREGAADLVLVSVPGEYAAAEAGKALDLGMNVMIFSDNVNVEDEVALKELADRRGLMLMGPDCGTAIINGVPLGFANVVRRGRVGVIGASGTGMQEVTSRVHRLGAGVSQAIGCGGRDLSAGVAGRTMRAALRRLASDPATDVIVLVSKPPAPGVLADVIETAQLAIGNSKRVVAAFIGLEPAALDGTGIIAASSLADAADIAVGVATGREPAPSAAREFPRHRRPPARPPGSVVRGAFVGGTFCHEAAHLFDTCGISEVTSTGEPLKPSRRFVDFGDDEYTRGRPHPMIDPALRDRWVSAALGDPSTAVVLVDLVLGHGAHPRPAEGLLRELQGRDPSQLPTVIAHVCGSELDPQHRDRMIAELDAAGVVVADSNIEAAHWAVAIVLEGTRA